MFSQSGIKPSKAMLLVLLFVATNMSPATASFTTKTLRKAVRLWMHEDGPQEAIDAYGQISDWDTSAVTNMNWLFRHEDAFNEDISKWDTSNVVTMQAMFRETRAFNVDISKWNTNSVTNMKRMFLKAKAFNQDIRQWDTQKVGTMGSMFRGAKVFNDDIGSWNTHSVTNMNRMFKNAKAFNQDISAWDTQNVLTMDLMFKGAEAFNQDCANIPQWCRVQGACFESTDLDCPDIRGPCSDEGYKQYESDGTGTGPYDDDDTQWNLYCTEDRRLVGVPIDLTFGKARIDADTERMQSLTLSIVNETNSLVCVPQSIRHLPTIIIGGNATTESYVRSACFENVELISSIQNCAEQDPSGNANGDTYTLACGKHQVSLGSSSRFDTIRTPQVAVAHIKAIEKAYHAGHKQALMLESDADMSLVPHWGTAGLDAALQLVPSDYHVLRLFEWNRNASEMGSDPAPRRFSIDSVLRTPVGLQPVWGAVAYVVSRRGMRYLLDRWKVTETGMRLENNNQSSYCKHFMFTSECLLFMGPGVYQTHRSLFGHQMSEKTRRGSERKQNDEQARWMNEASSIDILSSYDLTQPVPEWHRLAVFPRSVPPPPVGICCDWPTDASACGTTETGGSACVVPASPWCSSSKARCVKCQAVWCNDTSSAPAPPSSPKLLPAWLPTSGHEMDLLDTVKYARVHSAFPVVVICRNNEPGSLRNTLLSLMTVRGISVDSVIVVPTRFMEPCGGVAREMGMQIASSLDAAFEQYLSAPALVVAEAGLHFSPDAMEFFLAVAPAVERDPTLWTVSASNRNARPCHIGENVLALHRTHVFPGPAWLLMRTVWGEQAGQSGWAGEELLLEWSRGREAVFPELPRVSNLDGVYNQDASLRWPDSGELADAVLLSNYDANLRARLVGPNVTHLSRVGEIPAGADPRRQFVLWYELEKGEQATELARHFGLWNDDIAQGSHHGVHDLMSQGARVLLVNTLEKEQSLLPFKPVHLKALKAKRAAASMHQPSGLPCAVRQCRWTMLAGDSNMKRVATALMDEKKMGRENWVRNAKLQSNYSLAECEDRWADNEWVMSDSGGCHIVTQRFMSKQRAVVELAANINDKSYCGKKLAEPVRADERRPKQPNLIWFGHGLWDLPNEGTSAPHNLNCADRFADVVSALKHLQASSESQVVWQTNYPIEKHPHIRNEYLEWEIQCQREIARVNGIPLFDMANFMKDVPQSISDDGYHISKGIAYGVANVLDVVAHGQPESAKRMQNVDDVSLALAVYAASALNPSRNGGSKI